MSSRRLHRRFVPRKASKLKTLKCLVAVTILWSNGIAAAQEPSGGTVSNTNTLDFRAISGFFNNYCVKCHSEKKQKGDVRLDHVAHKIVDHADVSQWQDILDALNTGEMPPEDANQPKPAELQQVIGIVTDNITDAHKRLAATGGVIKMRHLTKREYLGSMTDLFGDGLPTDILPDDVSGGIDTNGSNQFFSLKQYENFYKAGHEVIEKSVLAYASPPPTPTTIRHDPEIVPAETAKARYDQMVKVLELINADAPITEISKVDPKIADAGQIKLFVQRYPKRIVKPKADFENTDGRQGVSGNFTLTTAARPLSRYTVTVAALKAGHRDVNITVNGNPVGSLQFTAGKAESSEVSFSTSIFDSTLTIRVEGHKTDDYDCLNLAGPFEHKNSHPSFFEATVNSTNKSIVQSQNPSDSEVTALLKRFAERAFRYQGVDDAYIAELLKVYQLERSAGSSTAAALVEPLTAVVTAPGFLYIKKKMTAIEEP